MGNCQPVTAKATHHSLFTASARNVVIDNTILDSGLMITPAEVVFYHILPYLEYNDLIRLRRVCKRLKCYSDDYLWKHPFNQERQISEKNFTIWEYSRTIPTKIPFKRLYINSSDPEILIDPLIFMFSKDYAEYITHLRVDVLSKTHLKLKGNLCGVLKHLTHLEVKTFVLLDKDNWEFLNKFGIERRRSSEKIRRFWINFKQLKVLKIHQFRCTQRIRLMKHDACPNLELLMCPRYILSNKQDGDKEIFQDASFEITVNYVFRRQKDHPDKPNLKFLDFQGCKAADLTMQKYLEIMHHFSLHNIKILNWNAELHKLIKYQRPNDRFMFDFPIVSLTNVQGQLDIRQMPYLEKLEITGACTVTSCNREDFQLPNLSSVNITIGQEPGNLLTDTEETKASIVEVLFNPAFGTKDNLKELKMKFLKLGRLPDYPKYANKWAFGFVNTCKNLTSLTLINWKGTGRELFIVWKGLHQLQNLELSHCKTIDDYSFLGIGLPKPAFLCLTKLEKLTLNGLEVMPGISDKVFEKVFRHTKLKQLYLKSKTPMSNITEKGIRSLLTGQFSETVERFPFDGFAIEGMSKKEHLSLSMEFRSYRMI